MVADAALLSTQHYKVQIKSKVKQSMERSSTLSYSEVAIIKGSLRVALSSDRQLYFIRFNDNSWLINAKFCLYVQFLSE